MSNSLDGFLTRIGDVTIERVERRGGSSPGTERLVEPSERPDSSTINDQESSQTALNDDSSDLSSSELSAERQKKNELVERANDIEEIREDSQGSGDDMDLDETIDAQIGVRMESERQDHSPESSSPEDDSEPVNILDTLPLEGAPIEGQEVTEADLLGQPLKDDEDEDEDNESIDNDKLSESMSGCEEELEGNKRRADGMDSGETSSKKKQKKDEGNDDSQSECETKAEKKLANMRRNIREVMDETQLDEATLSAQRQEMERLRRVQEQQRIIREVQRQIAINRQNSKTQTRVISLLQGKQGSQGDTTISETTCSSSQVRLPSSVMLNKVSQGGSAGIPGSGLTQTSSGTQCQMPRRPMDAMRWQKGRASGGQGGSSQTSISRLPNRNNAGQNMLQQRIRMMTPSVSISPVVPKKEPLDRADYYSDSDLSDLEADESAMQEKQQQMQHAMRKVVGAPKSGKPAKGKDVVTISSSSESSDDDCIVLSDHSGAEETDNEDDPSNSGMHTNDRYNLPDEHGRVLINVGHPDAEPDVYLAPQVARIIKPHQIGGIRFLFDNIVESIERYKSSSGFGCILAHSMGLGKTLQVASFCDIFFRCTTAKTVLCIMPINTLQNWLAEFNMWLPYEDPSSSCDRGNEEKNVNSASGIKTESIVDPYKNEIKDELMGNQSDLSNASRPISTESAGRMAHDNIHQPQHALNDPHHPYTQHQTYEGHPPMMSQYGQDPMIHKNPMDQANYHAGIGANSMYPPAGTIYDPMKQEMQGVVGRPGSNNYPMNTQNPTGIYPNMEQSPLQTTPGYPEMENRNNPGQMYSGINNHGQSPSGIYPGYENSGANQSYGNYGQSAGGSMPHADVKKEEISGKSEMNVKTEPQDRLQKEEVEAKECSEEDKKPAEKVGTPYSVDSPIGMTLRPRHFRLHILNDSHKTMAARARVIREWQKVGGVLLIGYELYRQLSLKKPNKAKRKRNQPFKDTVDVEEEDKNKGLLDDMHTALVSPGPDLVICDEGHRIKNSHASISLALKQMKTKRRIVLTGYPLQNNLLEYWCMVDFVRPNYLGTKSEFCNMFERPIQNGQCIDSTPQDIRLMRYRAHVLHALLEGFVQRRSHSVLQISLPRKEEYILLVRLTPHQRKLYDTFMNQVVKTRAVPNPLKAFAVCCKIWNHPDILFHFLRKRQQANEEDDLDLEETMGEKPAPGGKRGKQRQVKGEPKKGKKVNATNLKNKPAASVPPTSSSSSSNDVNDAENPHGTGNKTGGPFSQAYPQPMANNSNYQNPATSGNAQQANYTGGQNYPNYRQQQNEQNNYYRSDTPAHGGEYNEFYGNQQQPQARYGQNLGQSGFPGYSQGTPGYNSTQNYHQNQHSYVGNNEQQSRNPGFAGGTPQSAEFRSETGTNGNYENPEMFPRPYGFGEQARGYSGNLNQTSGNYPGQPGNTSNFQPPQIPQQQSQQQQSSNVPLNDYGTYGNNPAQNYSQTGENNGQMYPRTDNHQMGNQALGYTGNSQPNTNNPNQTSNYMTKTGQNSSAAPGANQNREFPVNSTSSNPMMQPSGSHGYPSGGQNSSSMPMQSPHGYPSNQVTAGGNAGTQNSSHNYPANSQTQTVSTNNQQGYNGPGQGSLGQNSIRGFSGNQANASVNPGSNQTNYGSSQAQSGSIGGSQPQNYPGEAQGTTAATQNPLQAYPGSHLAAPTQPNNPNTTYPQNPANQTTATNYSANQQPPSQTQRYGASGAGQSTGLPQNPSINYSGQQNPNAGLTTGEQMPNYSATNTGEYSLDRQGRNPPTPNPTGNYMASQHGSSQTQNSIGNYPPDAGAQNSAAGYNKSSEDPYWQRNYQQTTPRQDQCNQEQYFREPSSNRYPNNYYQGQNYGATSAPYDGYPSQQAGEDVKNSQGIPRAAVKDAASGMNQNPGSLGQNNAPAGYNGNEGRCTNMPMPPQPVGGPRQVDPAKDDDKEKEDLPEKDKDDKSDDEIMAKDEEKDSKYSPGSKEEPGIPYDWATDLMKGYVPGLIDASAKMTLFFCILEEAVRLGDRVLAFSQSLFTLNLIEDFLARNDFKYADGVTESWVKNINYYRLDGSTSALEREKLINEFNSNPKIHLFLVSTRAGSLGINLVGANRAIVFDASWNPCHDTQAVCRVYRYGQRKPCFVYRLVTDNCLERKIYDRQISKQGMADRVVDQCNPDAHLSLKEATTLSWDWEEDSQIQDFSQSKDNYGDQVMHLVLERYSSLLTKEPFHHESLLVDRKDKKLSQAEKRLARRGYELEKMAANSSRPSYSYVPGNTATRAGGLQIRAIRGGDPTTTPKPVASVRPMQQRGAENLGNRGIVGSRWIPAEVWQRQGMSAQEMTLPLDVVIPTNSPDKGSIVLKAGQRVMVLKSPKGIYMQLESGKIIAIRTALKLNQQKREEEPKKGVTAVAQRTTKPEVSFPLRNNSAISIIPKTPTAASPGATRPLSRPGIVPGCKPFAEKDIAKRGKAVATGAAKPQISSITTLTTQVSLQRLNHNNNNKGKQQQLHQQHQQHQQPQQDHVDHSSLGDNSNSSDSQLRTDQRVEEVRLEDVVAEKQNDEKPQGYGSMERMPSNTRMGVRQSSEDSTLAQTTLESKETGKSEQMMNYGYHGQSGEKLENRGDVAIEDSSGKLGSIPTGTSAIQQESLLGQPEHLHHQTQQMGHRGANEPAKSVDPSIAAGRGDSFAAGGNSKDRESRDMSQEHPHALAQAYPYAQYPRYYDYGDPRARALPPPPPPSPYGTYFPGVAPQPRVPVDAAKPAQQPELPSKSVEERNLMPAGAGASGPSAYPQSASSASKAPTELNETKNPETASHAAANSTRDEPHVPTAFSHPASSRYPAPYPPAPYDPYTQHYPPGPASSAAYPPSGAPGYAAYGGPTYNTDYARMYSAFHGPPPAADPYMHRGYAPPSAHPTNYYPPFGHPPPPPYPNYSFLPPYPNPNMPGEPQPPTQ